MPWCSDCRSFHFRPDIHFPNWETNVISWLGQSADDADWRIFRASTAESAAIRAAEEYDSEDYPLLKGGDVVILVRLEGSTEVVRFRCTGESVPQYSADEITEAGDSEA